jgi:Ca2+/H+ antiporter
LPFSPWGPGDGLGERDPRQFPGAFATAVGLSEFFISVVIVAIVGNAAEHGGAIVIARNGKMRLASEIASPRAPRSGCSSSPS